MPRVPEFNIDRNISTRVENEALPRIMADTRQLQAIGAQALKIEDQLVKAKESADVLKTNSTLEKSLDNTMPEIEKMFTSIDNKDIDPDEGLKKINETLDAYDADATGALAASGVADKAGEMYAQYTAPRIADIRKEAEKRATSRKVKNQSDAIDTEINVMTQRFADGVVGINQMFTTLQKISSDDVKNVIGVDAQDKKLAEAHRKFASASIAMISSQGATPDNIAIANKLIGSLPEAERRPNKRTLDETIKRTEVISLNKASVEAEKLMKQFDSPREIEKHTAAITNLSNTLANTPPSEHEDLEKRKETFSKLVGKQVAAEVFIQNPSISDFSQIIVPNKMSTQEMINDKINAITKGLSTRQIASIFGGEDALKKSITESVNNSIAEYQSIRATDPVGYYAGMDNVISKLETSNNPAEVEQAIYKLADEYTTANVPYNMRDIVSPSQAKQSAKTIAMFTEKGYDPSGEQLYGYITNLSSKYGDFSQQALVEFSNKAKDFPPSMIAVARMSSPNNAMSVTAGHNNYDAYLDVLKDSAALSSSKEPKRDYEALVQKKISDEMGSYISMINGMPNQATPIYKSIRDSVQYMAVDIAIKSGSSDVKGALDKAIERTKKEFPLVSDGVNSIMIDAKYADENKIDVERLDAVLVSMKSMKFVDSLDSSASPYKMDFEYLGKQFEQSHLKPRVDAIVMMAKSDRFRAMEMFADTFKDSLVVSPDPAYPNRVSYYIKNNTGIVPLVGKDGKGNKPISVDVSGYFRKYKVQEDKLKEYRR